MKYKTVTLSTIRQHGPCEPSWVRLLRHLGKTQADDTEVPLLEILDLLGLDDCLWALRALPPGAHGEVRLLVCDLVEPALQYTTDSRPSQTLEVARRHAQGEATDEELAAARAAAWAAASAAASAVASAAADTAAWAAAWAAVSAAARAAAWAEQERILRRALGMEE